jgi:hypothetical protein
MPDNRTAEHARHAGHGRPWGAHATSATAVPEGACATPVTAVPREARRQYPRNVAPVAGRRQPSPHPAPVAHKLTLVTPAPLRTHDRRMNVS